MDDERANATREDARPDEPARPGARAKGPARPDPPPGSGSGDPGRSPDRRRLRRHSTDRVFAGVASGLAEYLGVSSLAMRTLFGFAGLVVVLVLFGEYGNQNSYGDLALGFGPLIAALATVAVFAYLAMWIFVPSDDAGATPVGRVVGRFPRLRTIVAFVALLAGAAVLGEYLGLWDDGVLWPLLLIGAGVLLYRRDAERTTDAAATPSEATDAAAPPANRPPRERSPLGWLGLGVALLVVGVTAVLQNLGAIDVRLVRYPALALLILGATMLVGAFAGRARWVTLPALLVVPFVLAASVITVPLEGGVGDVYERPPNSAAVSGAYRRVAGSVYLDLTRLAGTTAEPVISVSTGMGSIDVLVPFDAHMIATGRAGAGSVQIGPRSVDTKFGAFLSGTWEPRLGDGPTITLDLETGLGDVRVYRAGPTPKQRRALEKQP